MKRLLTIALIMILAVALFTGFVHAEGEASQFTIQYHCEDDTVYPGGRVTLTAKYSTGINTGYTAEHHVWKFQWYASDTNSNVGGVKIPMKPNAPDGEEYKRSIPVKNEDGVFPGYSQGPEYIPNTTEPGTKYYYCEITHTADDGTDELLRSNPVAVTVAPRPENHPLDGLLTYAEKSGWTESTSSADVIAYYEEVAANSGGRVRLQYSGTTFKEKPIPLVIIGDPAPSKPADIPNDKAVILLNASLHSGEVEGKESMMIFTREIAMGLHDDILKDVVILIVANGNPDGNDTLNKSGINQYTPKYYGNRTNTAVGTSFYNINRDMMKLVSAEGTALTAVFNKWEPDAFADLHTTNGSFVRVPMETLWNLHPDMDSDVMEYNGGEFVEKALIGAESYMGATGRTVLPYGDFSPGSTGYRDGSTFVCGADERPVYTSHYGGMRNRLSLLFEVYSHDAYTTRVDTMYTAVKSYIYAIQEEKDVIKGLIAQADERLISRADGPDEPKDVTVSVQRITETTNPGETKKLTVPSYVGTSTGGNTRYIVTDDFNDRAGSIFAGECDYTNVSWEGPFNVTRTTPMGAYYLIDADCAQAVALLERHGIQVSQLTEAVTLGADEFQWFEATSRTGGSWENNATNTITGDWKTPGASQVFPAGTYVVSTAQIHGNLAALLMEPGIRDSVVYYHFLNEQMENYTGTVRENYISADAGNIAIPIYKVASFSSLPSNIAYLKAVLDENVPVGRETGTADYPKLVERSVENDVDSFAAGDIVTRDANATVKLGKSPENLGTSEVALETGANTIYVEVTAENGQTKLYYKLVISRSEPSVPTSYTVTFVPNGGGVVPQQTVTSGGLAEKPADPVRSGYIFRGWYTEAACTNAYDFKSAVTNDLTLYARWTVDYYDDTTNHWARENILDMTEVELFNGTGARKFSPDENLSRAMFITVLWRIAGEPVSNAKSAFTDVEAGSWYAKAVAWGAETGVTKGTSATKFSPYESISREMMATMMYRYAQVFKLDTALSGDLSKFTDAGRVSDWASDGIKWAVGYEVIQGKPKNLIDPTGMANRAEAATVVARFLPLT